ncbi:MAG TPA: aspartate kinase [Armatimonadetes bacterium]|jgi:aspartate kinase|nr:aspartate kinase [Armatimonadota bacterium]
MGSVVCKFGGTSVASAAQVRKVESIIRSDARRRFLVPSAPGKRYPSDKKITDLLYTCHQLAEHGLSFAEPYQIICDRYLELARELEVSTPLERELAEIERQLKSGTSRDYVASRGEYLSGRIIADYLGARFVDPADGIRLTPDGHLDPASYTLLAPLLQGDGLFVVPGFYGRGADGGIRTFSRGGSDITGAVVARAVDADVYENWTDVSGLLMADPRIVPDAQPIREVTYRELRELSYMGASVFHEEAMFPVRQANIPINIRNTNAPEEPGTLITPARDASGTPIVGVAGRTGFSMVYIEKELMNQERGFGRKVLDIIETHGISFEHAPTGIDSMCVIFEDKELGDKAEELIADFHRALKPDRIGIVNGLALIATVGEGMVFRVGTAARLFTAIANTGVNVRIIAQGSSEINIIIGVDEKDFAPAVQAIYHAFVD